MDRENAHGPMSTAQRVFRLSIVPTLIVSVGCSRSALDVPSVPSTPASSVDGSATDASSSDGCTNYAGTPFVCTTEYLSYQCPSGALPETTHPNVACGASTSFGSGERLYCCVDYPAGMGCAAVHSIPCALAFHCTGASRPEDGNRVLSCDDGAPNGDGSDYCCDVTTPAPGPCRDDPQLTCAPGQAGFICYVGDTPEADYAGFACSEGQGVPRNMRYCCASGFQGSPCTPYGGALAGCPFPGIAFKCNGSARPDEIVPSLEAAGCTCQPPDGEPGVSTCCCGAPS